MNAPLFCFYGDDVTGSTDALEALASNGVPTVLFLDPPTVELREKYSHFQAFGIAGQSRSQSPSWMDANLPSIFHGLKESGAPLCQYKVCSTFDSSPTTGSIGRALEIGRRVFEASRVPIAIAAPHLKRYVLFGNLFAAAGDAPIHRIDRHPTMRHHPVTPMNESDLRIHLGAQTGLTIGLVDILSLDSGDVIMPDSDAVLFDGLSSTSVASAAEHIWSQGRFCIGSSGLTHGLLSCWPRRTPNNTPASCVDQILVLSGSCSPVTANQIKSSGYTAIRLSDSAPLEALAALRAGMSVIVYSALGEQHATALPSSSLGQTLGDLLLYLLRESTVRRVVLAGGDTSSHAIRRLGIEALTFASLLAPGAPLCRVSSSDPTVDGIELVLKGGQVGPLNFFEAARTGKL